MNIPNLGFIVPNMGMKKKSAASRSRPAGGIANALFTKVQQRVLGVLYGNPGRSFFANELIALAASGTGAVQRELIRLEGAGLVTASRVGKQKHYQANSAAPVFEELRGLILKTSGLADVLRTALAPIASQIQSAFVYGSVAKGQDTANSDVDLMIVSETLTYADFFGAIEEATARLGRQVNPTIYANKELAKRMREGNAFVTRIRQQPKVWLIGEEHGFAAGESERSR